jgi:hypothetical protein
MSVFECIHCDRLLTKEATQDWGAKGGVCDNCSEQLADSSLMREQAREEANEAWRTDN